MLSLAYITLHLYIIQAMVDGGGLTFFGQVLYFLLFAIVLIFLLKVIHGEVTPTSHWYHHFAELHLSGKEFYSTIEAEITRKEMPHVTVSRVSLSEGNFISDNRLYLRIERKNLLFDLCAAPFGHGFFISWWQGERLTLFRRLVAAIPFLGRWMERALFPITYYFIDTEEMFKNSIHNTVLEIVDGITKEKGIRGLTELERKPIDKRPT